MGANAGNYSRGGNPAVMFGEENLYLDMMPQAGKPAVDADFNDAALMRIHARRRIIEAAIGDGSPNNGFKISEAAAPTNNFKITGGGGTADTAGRLFESGWSCLLFSDVDYSGAFVARMRKIHPQVTTIAALVLTDGTANWAVNEHVGKTLCPNIENPGTTFTVASNTATTITVTAGDLTTATAVRKHYRIELSTPGGGRTDEVYLDIFLDEGDALEDTNLVHPAGIGASANRWILRQFVRVKEGGVTPAGHVDVDGRQHYTVIIASLQRLAANANVLTAMLVDQRTILSVGGGSSLTVEEADGIPTVPSVTKIRVPNGSLTPVGPGDVLLTLAGGGGGTSTGLISVLSPLSQDITGITAPFQVTLGTDVDAQRHPDGSTTGQRVSFQVPEDYDSGSIEIVLLYKMQAAIASPNNVVRISTQAKIVNTVMGALDTASYPETEANLTVPDNLTTFVRASVLSIASSAFNKGDVIVGFVKRIGAHANDLATTGWDVVGYEWRYTGQVATRATTQSAHFWQDAAGETPTAGGTLGTDIDTEDFPSGTDSGQKVVFLIPDNWDEFSEAVIRVDYAMSTALASQTVRLATYGEVVDPVTGAITSIPSQTFDLVPSNDVNPHRTVAIRMIAAALINRGSVVTLVIARRTTAVPSNHTGLFKAVILTCNLGISPAAGFVTPSLEEKYLEQPIFGNASVAGIWGDVNYPTFGGDFEPLVRMYSTLPAGRIDVAFQGRLSVLQSLVTRVAIGIKGVGGSPQYRLKLYADGSAGTPIFDSGLLAAPGALTVTSLTDLDLSSQPIGTKRYFVVVEAYCDASEEVLVTRPFVRQE